MKKIFYILNLILIPLNSLIFYICVFFKSKNENTVLIVSGNHASGTTLLYQIIASLYNCNFINNLSGKFFNNLTIVSFLNYFTAKFFSKYISNFNSSLGNTNGFLEPNEFGWFWVPRLSKRNNYNSLKLHSEIKEISYFSKLPLLIKYVISNNYDTTFNNLSKFKK